VPTPGLALGNDLTRGDVEGSEQRGCNVPLLVVSLPFRDAGPERKNGLGEIQALDLALLIPTEHDRLVGRTRASTLLAIPSAALRTIRTRSLTDSQLATLKQRQRGVAARGVATRYEARSSIGKDRSETLDLNDTTRNNPRQHPTSRRRCD
jgi:hypothetical protein